MSLRISTALLLLLACLGLASCTSGSDDGKDHKDGEKHSEGDGHDHKDGEDHSGHDHGDGEHDDHSHGESHALGAITIGSITVTATQLGAVEAGKDAVFEFALAGGKAKNLRCWVGNEDGKGAVKAGGEKQEDGGFHTHAEIRALSATDKLWIELELEDGTKKVGSIAIDR